MTKNKISTLSADRALKTIERTKSLPSIGIRDWDWPDYKSENDRIRQNNKIYQDMPLDEAMFKMAGKKVNSSKLKHEECRELNINDVVMLQILDVTKKGVVFDNSVYKEDISCNVNLYQYEKLRNFLPKYPIQCKVVSKSGNKVTVDPFVIMFDKWLDSKLDDGRHGKIPARSQYNIEEDKSVTVKNLRLLKGGYTGTVRIDTISDFVGQDVCADAFIPGSQIVLNIENDFSRWEGASVKAFVSNYMKRPGTANAMSIVCSRKEVLKFRGQQNMIKIFSDYTEENDDWKALRNTVYEGTVTGVLRSAKKCGVFVEIDKLDVTGMVEVPASELVNYQPQSTVKVRWSHFDEPMRYNKEVDQFQHIDPYVIENGILKEFNIKPIFEFCD